MTKKALGVHNCVHLAELLFIVCVPTALATMIVGIRAPDGFVIATDSKVVYRGSGAKVPGIACKIYQSGNLYFALAGMAPHRDFSPEKIVARNSSVGDSLPHTMEKLEPAISDALLAEMKKLKAEDPDAFAYNSRSKVDMLTVIAGEMVDGVPQMSGRGFDYAAEPER